MRSRQPSLDFSDSLPVWTRQREFSHILNGASIVIMQLEPFLNKVMRRAQAALPADDPLQRDLSVFIRQEATHCQLHKRYNQALYDAGYHQLKEIETQLGADYERMLRENSMKDLLAYCEGFECLGPLYAQFLYEHADDLLEGADPAVSDLWKWHFAEEYEHRLVAYDTYHRFGGGWLHRLYRTFTTLRHLRKYNTMVAAHLLDIDRRGMNTEQAEQSRRTARMVRRRLSRFLLPRMLRLLSPFYSPATSNMPRGLDRYLAMDNNG